MSLQDYLALIEKEEHKKFFAKLTNCIMNNFSDLELVIKWNQPMFVYHGTFIISLSASKKYVTVSVEEPLLKEFKEELSAFGYKTKRIVFHIKYTDQIAYDLFNKMIKRIIDVKKDCKGFWL